MKISFRSNKKFIALVILPFFQVAIYLINFSLGAPKQISLTFSFLLFLLAYFYWSSMYTKDGDYFYNRFVRPSITRLSYANTRRLKLILSVGLLYLLISLSILWSDQTMHQLTYSSWLYFTLGLSLGCVKLIFFPEYNFTAKKYNLNIVLRFFEWSAPLLFTPIVFSTNKNIWCLFTFGFGISFIFSQTYVLMRHFSINKRLSIFSTPDEESIPSKNEVPITYRDSSEFSDPNLKISFSEQKFAGLSSKEINSVAKEIITDLVSKTPKDEGIESDTNKLRDRIRLWYSERRYDKVISIAEAYIKKIHDKGELHNLSYAITSLYVKSLIRIGNIKEAENQLFMEFGKTCKDILINTEKAYVMWEKGDSAKAIALIRELITERPQYNAGKNCLAFYLCDSAIDDIAGEIYEGNENPYDKKHIATKLNESWEILSEVYSTSDLIGSNSYFWSNVGFHYMVKDDFDHALNNYYSSLRSRENVRSRIGIALISLSMDDWQNLSLFHFSQALTYLNNNRSSRYWNVANMYLEIIELLIRTKRMPDRKIVYFTNRLWEQQKRDEFISFDIDRLLDVLPRWMIPEYVHIRK
jgi:tetratricopeptide (TPR) repeat protein